jgi:hypothetical protein
LCVSYRSILQEFEDKLKTIKDNTAGNVVSFYNAGLNDKDCARLCEALEVIVQPLKQDIGLSLAAPLPWWSACLTHVGHHVLRMLVSAPPNHVFSIDSLQVNKHLTSLSMRYNPQITDKGWAEFAKGLAVSIRAVFHPMAPEMSTHN